MPNFCHLHVHSHYSLLDGLDSPNTLARAAKEQGHTAIAITDHGTLSSHREMHQACIDEGIKPILGVEAYISPTDRFDKRKKTEREIANDQAYNHIILLAKNQTGLDNINKLSKIAWEEGFYNKPRIDRDILYDNRDGIIVLSGCFNGIPAKAVEAARESGEQEYLRNGFQFLAELKDYFQDDAYVELQPHNDDYINQQLYDWATALDIKPLVTGDCHYAYPEDRALEDAFLVLATNPKQQQGESYSTVEKLDLMDKLNALYPDRFMTFRDIDVYVSGRDTLEQSMAKQGLDDPVMFESTLEVADKVDFTERKEGLDLLPSKFNDPVAELESLVIAGLQERGIYTDKYIERMTEEMRVIRMKNFAPYFLIEYDIMNEARRRGIMTGPGRGSAVSSLVCYALGITKVDPLEYNLLFARFINEERNDYPDIDSDFEDERRAEIKEYLRDKYGHVASIATYTYLKDKRAIKDAAKILAVPYADVESAMREVPQDGGMEHYTSWTPKLDANSMPKDKLSEFKLKYPDVEPLALQLQNRLRGSGMHAGGIVVSKSPIEWYAPIETKEDKQAGIKERIPVAAYDMGALESIGLIKFDILGLSTLTVIRNTLDLLAARDVHVDLDDIDLDDPAVHRELSRGHTVGVFQADATPYTKLLSDIGCSNFNELVASNALVRPGAMDTVGPAYARRKAGQEDVTYVHDIMQPYLEDTYGVVIYQEQVMQAAVELGGLSWSKADKLRKIIGKKRDASEFEQYRDEFVTGAERYISRKQAEQLWHDFEAHAGYSFNKSHAVAYSMLTVWTMWLKINYPTEYLAALLMSVANKANARAKTTEYLIEARRLGVEMLLPHINQSGENYTVENGKIRFGLSSVKYISTKVAEPIIANRPYKSYKHFLQVANTKYSGINSRAIDALNKIGGAAFEDNPRREDWKDNLYEYMGIPRFESVQLTKRAQDVVTDLVDFTEGQDVGIVAVRVAKIDRKTSKRTGRKYIQIHLMDDTGTMSIFHGGGELPTEGEFYYMLVAQSNIMDFVPIKEMKKYLKTGYTTNPVIEYMHLRGDKLVDESAAYVVKCKERRTKKGDTMADLIVADRNRKLYNFVVFPSIYGRFKSDIKEGKSIKISTKTLDDGGKMVAAVYGD